MAKRKATTPAPAGPVRESKRLKGQAAENDGLQILNTRGRALSQPSGKAAVVTGRTSKKAAVPAASVASSPAGQGPEGEEEAAAPEVADQHPDDFERRDDLDGTEAADDAEQAEGDAEPDAKTPEDFEAGIEADKAPVEGPADEGVIEGPVVAAPNNPVGDDRQDGRRHDLQLVSTNLIKAQSLLKWLEDALWQSQAVYEQHSKFAVEATRLLEKYVGENDPLVEQGTTIIHDFPKQLDELQYLQSSLPDSLAACQHLIPRLMRQEVALERGGASDDPVLREAAGDFENAQLLIKYNERLVESIREDQERLWDNVLEPLGVIIVPGGEQHGQSSPAQDLGRRRPSSEEGSSDSALKKSAHTHGERPQNANLRREATAVGTKPYEFLCWFNKRYGSRGLTKSGTPRCSVEGILYQMLLAVIEARNTLEVIRIWVPSQEAVAYNNAVRAEDMLYKAAGHAHIGGYDVRPYLQIGLNVRVLASIQSGRRPSNSSSVLEAAKLLPFAYLRKRETASRLIEAHQERMSDIRGIVEHLAGRPVKEDEVRSEEGAMLLPDLVEARKELREEIQKARLDGFSVSSDGPLRGRAWTGTDSAVYGERPSRYDQEICFDSTLYRAGVARYLKSAQPLEAQCMREYGVIDVLDARERALALAARNLKIKERRRLDSIPLDETEEQYQRRIALIRHMILARDRARLRDEVPTFNPARRFSATSCACPICRGEIELG